MNDPENRTIIVEVGDREGPFTALFDNLDPNKEYSFIIVAETRNKRGREQMITIKTPEGGKKIITISPI